MSQKAPAAVPEASLPTILVAEDDHHMRALIATILGESEHGFHVVTVENAHDAMDYVENNEVAVVVTDLRMPGAE